MVTTRIVAVVALAASARALTDAEPALATNDAGDQVEVSFAATSTTLSLNEPLVVEIRIENRGAETIIGDLGADYKTNVGIAVTLPGGISTSRLFLATSAL